MWDSCASVVPNTKAFKNNKQRIQRNRGSRPAGNYRICERLQCAWNKKYPECHNSYYTVNISGHTFKKYMQITETFTGLFLWVLSNCSTTISVCSVRWRGSISLCDMPHPVFPDYFLTSVQVTMKNGSYL